MSACRRHAVSQVGCRLMVASNAKISRPRCPEPVAGARLFTLLRNTSISERVDWGAGARAAPAGAGVRPLRSLDIRSRPGSVFAPKVDISGWWRNGAPTTQDGTTEDARSSLSVVRRLSSVVRALLLDHVVHFERRLGGSKPFGAGCGAPLAACVERELERLDQSHDFG